MMKLRDYKKEDASFSAAPGTGDHAGSSRGKELRKQMKRNGPKYGKVDLRTLPPDTEIVLDHDDID